MNTSEIGDIVPALSSFSFGWKDKLHRCELISECVQLRAKCYRMKYKFSKNLKTEKVPIGCMCMFVWGVSGNTFEDLKL